MFPAVATSKSMTNWRIRYVKKHKYVYYFTRAIARGLNRRLCRLILIKFFNVERPFPPCNTSYVLLCPAHANHITALYNLQIGYDTQAHTESKRAMGGVWTV